MRCLRLMLFLLLVFNFVLAGAPIRIGKYPQEICTKYDQLDGLPTPKINALANSISGKLYAGSDSGIRHFVAGSWQKLAAISGESVTDLAVLGNTMVAVAGRNTKKRLVVLHDEQVQFNIKLPHDCDPADLLIDGKNLLLGCKTGLFQARLQKGAKVKKVGLHGFEIRQLTQGPNRKIFAATDKALIAFDLKNQQAERLFPGDGKRSWAPVDVRTVFLDKKGRLWFASPQGIGCFENSWQLFTGAEGLPFDDFTCGAAMENGDVWFGTTKGAIRFDGNHWAYRQGRRWLPDDRVRDIVADGQGGAWLATATGVSRIHFKSMTLAEKAKYFENEIDKFHRRTPYEFVLEVGLPQAGVKKNLRKHDSDNDGLWTSMYGAGECFAYAATKDPLAKKRATKAFKAMEFLRKVTQGAKHSPPPGFVARTVLPTDGPDPNLGRIERDCENRKNRDKLWKVYEPRWPRSADGKWYWKTDTSSDELDGHYFLYALYFDLVAETQAEKTAVRQQVRALTDHLINHDFQLVDHDGKPTRWSRFTPKELNFSKFWFVERGLNSLSMLSYLSVAEHVTGDRKYGEIKKDLIENHSYMQNMMRQKFHHGIGTGNQSDDEMAFMAYYHLLKYETNPAWRSQFSISLWDSWKIEEPEMNPLFNFIVAAVASGLSYTDAYGTHPTDPTGTWLEDAIETLQRIPLDRVNWRHDNRQRIDIVRLHPSNQGFDESPFDRKGYRTNGKVIPADESFFNHWNHDVWRLQSGSNGHGLGDGTIFLLPYYMGLYHGFIEN